MLAGWRFRRALSQLQGASQPALSAYASADWPERGDSLDETEFLALDFELDGLGRDAHILQAGWVPFSLAGIPLARAVSRDVRSTRTLDERAVTIHGIGEQRAREGCALPEVMEELVAALAGRVLIAHGASIERGAIQRASKAVFGCALPVQSICTMAVEQKLAPGQIRAEPYRLAGARARYGLPRHDLHDALSDAIAAAELFLAQSTRLPPGTRLGSLEDLRVSR